MHEGNRERWAIIGGGILGMSLARRLAQHGKDVTIFEAAGQLGGMAAAWQLGDFGEVVWDKHYHVILQSDSHLLELLNELNLTGDLRWAQTKTGFYTDGQFYSMSNTWEFLRFPPLWIWNKLRLAWTIYYASKIRNWKRLEKISVSTWLRRWSGTRTFEKIWRPLLMAKLGKSYENASASFIWAIIARMYAARRTGMKKEVFGYVHGGYARILERFAESLNAHGVRMEVNRPVRRIEPENGERWIEFADGRRESFDRIVITLPAPLAARMCPDLKFDETRRLRKVTYQGIICASMLLKEPLANFYVTNITDERVPFTAIIEMSALVDRAEFGGHALVYLPKYVSPDDPMHEESDDEIREEFLANVERMYPAFRREHILAFRISRVKHVLAVSTLNYSKTLPPMITSIPGVAIVNSAHIVNGTLNVNETLQLAERAIPQLLTMPIPVDPLLVETADELE